MQLMNTRTNYGAISKMFHWGMASVLLTAFILGTLAEHNDSPTLLSTHNLLGLMVLPLVLFRLCWRFIGITPSAIAAPRWQASIARLVFLILYFAMFAAPISGYVLLNVDSQNLAIFGVELPAFTLPISLSEKLAHNLHGLSADLLLYGSFLHIIAAIYHHIFLKDDVLRRMLPKTFS